MKKIIAPLAFLCLLAVSCQKDNEAAPHEYSIGAGQTVKLRDGYRITFVEITEDSRCPTCPTCGLCIWRGRAVATFVLTNNKGVEFPFDLTDYERPTLEPKETASVLGQTIQLLDVTPWPDGNPIGPSDYEVKIRVD